jgi:para-aminobenzoate synthetase component 1
MLNIHDIPWREPQAAFAAFAHEPYLAFLDSNGAPDGRSRYSYLCPFPFRLIEAHGGRVTVDGVAVDGDPFTAVAREVAQYPQAPGPFPFCGGAVGLFGYELGRWLERLPARHGDDPAVPDLSVGLYDVVIAFDRVARRACVLASGLPEASPLARRLRAEARRDAVLARLAAPTPPPGPPPLLDFHPEVSAGAHQESVARVLEYIRAGDIFQANVTMRHIAARPSCMAAADLYHALRAASAAPFGAYLACGPDLALASVSPERFLQLSADGRIETRPIKGTSKRASHARTDLLLAASLSESAKDRAENLMITDLMRNDIGRVAAIGSVSVPELRVVETFASVHHMVSAITGQLRQGLGAADLLRACFPGGSVTGAPKIRAMAIIDEIEVARRGPYCGSIAWLGFDGAMDSSIVIRTLVITRDNVIAQAGGGIVADSNPREEWEELLTKLAPLLLAGRGARG